MNIYSNTSSPRNFPHENSQSTDVTNGDDFRRVVVTVKSLVRGHETVARMIYFADFCDFIVTTTRRKSLLFENHWENSAATISCNKCSRPFLIVLLIWYYSDELIAELAERSPIIIQKSSNPSSRKKFGCSTVRPYKVLLLTYQLYRRHANATALFSSPVFSALGSESDDTGSSPGRGKACALETCGKK